MKRTISLALALAMCLSLASCGGQAPAPGSSGPSIPVGSQAAASSSAPDTSTPDASVPDVSRPEGGQPAGDAGAPAPDVSQPEQGDEGAQPVLSLNKDGFTLFQPGDHYRLRYTCQPDYDAVPEFTSSDDSVATVAGDGTVTAVAPGYATVTLEYGGLTASCLVWCRWEEEPEEPGGPDSAPTPPPVIIPGFSGGTSAPEAGQEPTPEQPAPQPGDDGICGLPLAPESTPVPEGSVDLAAFYDSLGGKYELPAMERADSALLEAHYPGLSAVSTVQCVHYAPMMTAVACEFTLVQVADAADVSAVKDILQARIDAQVSGGAWYPATIEQWQSNARIVTNGNYIMLAVYKDSDAVVSDFNALF